MIDTYWPPRTLWLRFGWSDNPALLRQAGEWARANGLDPAEVSGSDPVIIGRGRYDRPPMLQEPPTLTVVLMPLDPTRFERQPGDELLATTDPMRIRRTVRLRVPPPPELFVDVAAEVQRAGFDTHVREWLREVLDVTDDLAEALGHDRHTHPGRAALLEQVRHLREEHKR